MSNVVGALSMEQALALAAMAGTRLSWGLLPRAANRVADAAARAAAARALARGEGQPRCASGRSGTAIPAGGS